MMVHPTPGDNVIAKSTARCTLNVEFKGRNTHAAATPWLGLNALDAMIHAFQGIGLARQQFKPDWRVHGIITAGGLKPNIIPDHTAAEFYLRAQEVKDMVDLRERISNVFRGAAAATGTEVELDWGPERTVYAAMEANRPMCAMYRENMIALGKRMVTMEEEEKLPAAASSDIGNVSWVVPTIQPVYAIEASHANHHPGFTEFAGKDGA